MDVVLQVFDSDPIIPSFEARRILLSHQVDKSRISGGEFRWPFAIAPPSDSISSLGSSSGSSLGHQSSNGHSPVSDLKFQLIVTINRRGRLTRNIGVKQKIFYVPPPDPSLRSSPAQMSVILPPDTPTSTIASCQWTPQKLPPVVVRGVMFGEIAVEVECKLIIPKEYPAGDNIPLRLALTSENFEAIGLLSVPHVIDVRLQKVMDFGDRAGAVRPLNLRDHGAFFNAKLVAEANWEVDGHVKELPTNEQQRRPRWRIKLKGMLQRKPEVELTPSYEEPGVGVAITYIVGFFPFRATADFHPTNTPNRELIMGKIKLNRA